MSEKLFDMKPIRWNSPSSCCCDRTAPMVKLDASHSRWKGLDLDGKASVGVEVTVLFSTSKACCFAAPHDQSFFYQRFIHDFSQIFCPLHVLTRKSKDWSWGPAQQQAFYVIKSTVTSTPTHAFPF